MLNATLLGTGGMMPLPYRYLTSFITRYNGSSILIDCGEGTQVALRKAEISPNPIDCICFTHYHGDHISGIMGLLLSMGNSDRTEPVTLIGPKGLERVVRCLMVIAPELPFRVDFQEFYGSSFDFEIKGQKIHAFKVNHNVPCFGYAISVDRLGKFSTERATAQGIPLKFWNKLQHGAECRDGDRIYTPDMVMGPDRKGLKVVYATDTRPTESILENARSADLLVLEGMYGSDDKLDHVKERKHMLMTEACRLACEAGVPRLWLTHYSPAETRPQQYLDDLQQIFPGVVLPKDGHSEELNFEEDE